MTNQPPTSHFDTSPEAQAVRGRRGGRIGGISRSKYAQRFIDDFYRAWEEQGESVINRAFFHDPAGSLRIAAGLLPQKLEITHPTDGISDDRLAFLLQVADAMAERLAVTDEKRLIDVTPEKGGGGPERADASAGRVVNPLPPSAENSAQAEASNKLVAPSPEPSTAESMIAEESEYATHPPVGRACPATAGQEQRSNLKKLNDDEIVDPASLF